MPRAPHAGHSIASRAGRGRSGPNCAACWPRWLGCSAAPRGQARRGGQQHQRAVAMLGAPGAVWFAFVIAAVAVSFSSFGNQHHGSGLSARSARVRRAADYASLGGDVKVLTPQAPLAILFENAVSLQQSEHVVRRARSEMSAAFTGVETDGRDGRQGRSNTVAWLRHNESTEIWDLVQKVAAIVGIPSSHAEQLQVIRYERGQECAYASISMSLHPCCAEFRHALTQGSRSTFYRGG